MLRYTMLLILVSGLASAQQETRPSIVEAPLDFTPDATFGKATVGRVGCVPPKEGGGTLADRLSLQFHTDLTREPGITVPMKATWMGVTCKASRIDWAKSDVALGELAQAANTMYALYVSVSFGVVPGKGDHGILMVARVATASGKPFGDPVTVSEPKAGRQVSEVFRSATAKLFAALNLAGVLKLSLPAETQPSVALVPPPSPPPEEIRVQPPAQPLGVVAKSEPSVLKPVSYVVAGVGVAAVVAGVVLFATAPPIRTDSAGNVYQEDRATYVSSRTQRGAGVGLIAGGAAVAIAGGALALWAHSRPGAITTSLAPVPGGGLVLVGGDL